MGAYEQTKQRVKEELAEDDESLRLLRDIRDALAGEDAGYYEYGADEPAPGESDRGSRTAEYGYLPGLTATNEKQNANLGRVSDTVVIRNFSDALEVAFKDPQDHDDAWIPLVAEDDPFVLAGVYGIAAQTLWYRQGDGAAGNVTFDALSVKRRGR